MSESYTEMAIFITKSITYFQKRRGLGNFHQQETAFVCTKCVSCNSLLAKKRVSCDYLLRGRRDNPRGQDEFQIFIEKDKKLC